MPFSVFLPWLCWAGFSFDLGFILGRCNWVLRLCLGPRWLIGSDYLFILSSVFLSSLNFKS